MIHDNGRTGLEMWHLAEHMPSSCEALGVLPAAQLIMVAVFEDEVSCRNTV